MIKRLDVNNKINTFLKETRKPWDIFLKVSAIIQIYNKIVLQRHVF